MSNASHSFSQTVNQEEVEVVLGQTNSCIQTGWVVQTHSASVESPAMNWTTGSTMQASAGNQAATRCFCPGQTGHVASPGGETLALAPSALSSHHLSHPLGQRLHWLGWLWFPRAAAAFQHHCDRTRTPAVHILVFPHSQSTSRSSSALHTPTHTPPPSGPGTILTGWFTDADQVHVTSPDTTPPPLPCN